jgi:hypothetical protein
MHCRRFKHFSAAVVIVVIVCVQACQRPTRSDPSPQQRTSPNVFDAYLETDMPPADGFDFPLGDANARGPYKDVATGIEYDGWRIATYFAETISLAFTQARTGMATAAATPIWARTFTPSRMVASRLLKTAVVCGAMS